MAKAEDKGKRAQKKDRRRKKAGQPAKPKPAGAAPSRAARAAAGKKPAQRQRAPAAARMAVAAPAVSVTDEGQQDLKLQDIFQLISSSLVTAQQGLDNESLKYVSAISDPRLQPALYSIPTVRAEAKVGLQKKTGSNLFVRLFGSPTDKTNYAESSISFDIVASPPPPGAFATIPSFLVLDTEKDEAIKKATGSTTVEDQLRASATVFRNPQDSSRPYIVWIAGSQPGAAFQLSRVSLDEKVSPDSVSISASQTKIIQILLDVAASIRDWEQKARPPKPTPAK
jgi:hypothetical protein